MTVSSDRLFDCSAEVLSSSEHPALLQRAEILEEEGEQGGNRCYTLKSVKKVMKKVSKLNTDFVVGHCQ